MSRRRGNPESRNEQSNADVHQNGAVSVKTQELSQQSSASSSPALTASQTTAILQIWAPTLLLIFGGCCSNVYTLEALIHTSPTSGSLLTALQFLLVALATAPRHLSFSRGWRNLYLRERNIPLRKWLVYTAYFLSINILNNMAFKYRISVPLHIILRSAGPVMTMAVGRFWGGKRYPPHKIVAVLLLFAGVVLAAFSDAWAKPAPVAQTQVASQKISASSQAPGFALLASALLLSALMGLYTDDMYATHGRSTSVAAETLFYSHAMSLPYFASQARPLMHELGVVMTTAVSSFERDISGKNSTSLTKWSSLMPFMAAPDSSSMSHLMLLPVSLVLRIPTPIALLALNAGTQLLCIIGVNRLSAQSSSLTVGIVLNIRKLASLLLSICLFGNTLPMGVLVGAAIVFLGGGLYALPASATGASSSDTRQTEKKKV
ncbi:golgi uridine diphosphate-N-acetylglucosamine transporter [Elasticomyces elasticus]|uniref:Golgi uridine diphosphate-N- acetylglucosamine transporter n=1 Tax=Exophiala sideris TaxID=1016849 RepID=A0ABR0IX29_9EURO|nr:golgi uridine diphosphate-N-acetylglucosamine transporter [Elasticomyces elasticus]KAK5022044.1 golgi uridine diphosphate-N- acetylglucosamine transporter [Exophiala sideris]KAK5026287.1 golgi uridine diphosphate-N-acetylglucosamine transporter [Exophiala sideris]KAK5051077.1 golgi uridine diphosphate-N- acetylglucosamine transporter [Exophiala sideris]KAK5177279.1 golgi uridine diphosphate-N- acetylglucosamine transporter [Eurotiomycetes sp. CCFEE 6388]